MTAAEKQLEIGDLMELVVRSMGDLGLVILPLTSVSPSVEII